MLKKQSYQRNENGKKSLNVDLNDDRLLEITLLA